MALIKKRAEFDQYCRWVNASHYNARYRKGDRKGDARETRCATVAKSRSISESRNFQLMSIWNAFIISGNNGPTSGVKSSWTSLYLKVALCVTVYYCTSRSFFSVVVWSLVLIPNVASLKAAKRTELVVKRCWPSTQTWKYSNYGIL